MKILEEDIDAFKKKSYKKKVHFEKVMGLYPHVKKTLEAIQKMGVKNIILSDNESTEHEIREKVIGRFGLNEYIDQVISSKDCKCTKSNKKFFSLALKKLKLTANEVLFVAHDQDEIENAQKNKIKAVEYNNYLKIPLYPEYRISKFNQLLNVIK